MTRGLSAPNLAAAQAPVVRPVNLVELDYVSGFVRACSHTRTLQAFGNDFLGVGGLGRVKPLQETAEQRAQRILVELSGVDPALVAIALNERYRGRPGRWYRGYLDDAFELVDDPHLWFEGLIDTQSIELGTTATISVSIVDESVRWEVPLDEPLFDDAFQQSRRPGDLFFQFVPELVNGKELRP